MRTPDFQSRWLVDLTVGAILPSKRTIVESRLRPSQEGEPMSTEVKSMTIWEAAYKVLKQEGRPLHLRAIRLLIGDGNLFEFGARDPVKVLGVELDRHSAGVEVSKSTTPQLFYRASPATYGLLEWLSKDELEDLQTDATIAESAEQASLDSTLFLERELHLWLYKNLRENGLKVFGFGH